MHGGWEACFFQHDFLVPRHVSVLKHVIHKGIHHTAASSRHSTFITATRSSVWQKRHATLGSGLFSWLWIIANSMRQ